MAGGGEEGVNPLSQGNSPKVCAGVYVCTRLCVCVYFVRVCVTDHAVPSGMKSKWI